MADQGAIGVTRSDLGRRFDPGWPSAPTVSQRSDPGRRFDPGWPSATPTLARFKIDTIYAIPDGGGWTVPLPLTLPTPWLRQQPASWWPSAAAFSLGQPRGRNGTATLSGTVTVQGAPAARRVIVLDQKALEVVYVTASSAAGAWSVDGLDPTDPERYSAVCFFGPGGENAAVFDRLTPG
ncbi:MAG TPA: hypothetical protein PL166_11860 [Candidatus Contendobacter sp.]|nr:hypothetical protein [Candidatus Contendobacter sp.]